MQKEKSKIIISWILVAICMGVIFWLSSRTAEESAKQSSAILEWILKTFGENAFTDFIIRKLAHFLEFTGLCFLFNIAFYYTRGNASPFISTLCTSLYAVTDEVHQIFVNGRSCELRDWAIDSCGAIAGAIGAMILFIIISKLAKKCKKSIDIKGN